MPMAKRNRPCRMCGKMMFMANRKYCPKCAYSRSHWKTVMANANLKGFMIFHFPKLCEECGNVFQPADARSSLCPSCRDLKNQIFFTMSILRSRFADKMIADRQAALAFADEMEIVEGKEFRSYALDGIPEKSFKELSEREIFPHWRLMKFTYKYLESFLEYAKKIAPVVPLRDADGHRVIVMRHDVDFSLYPVRNVAKIEKKLGINSTFFIRTTCHTYNPLSIISREIIDGIHKEGFEIGLHFNPVVYGNVNHRELEKKVKFECGILESIIHEPITSLSLHNPSLMSGKYPIFEGYHNTYSKDVFSDECYLSDACMNFRGKDPYKFVGEAKKFPLQIVLHPMHWSDQGGGYVDIFNGYLHILVDDIDHLFRDNPTYRQYILDNKLSDFVFKEETHGY